MIKKKEWIYRDILERFTERKESRFTQLELSKKFSVSLSTVNNALAPLRSMGAIEVKQRGFVLSDAKKLMLHWATIRSLDKDVVYRTRMDAPPAEIEGMMPAEAVFTACSAFRMRYHEAPSDYSEVYVYADGKTLEEIKRRFPPAGGPPNIIVLASDPHLAKGMVSEPQLFADLWNIKNWYAKDFLASLERRLFE